MPDLNAPGVWDTITTGVVHKGLGDWRITLRYSNSVTGAEHLELSTRRWPDEESARNAANILAPAMRNRIINGGN